MTETTTIMTAQGLTSADSGKPTGARTPADALGEPKRMRTSESEGQESHECPTCGRDDFSTEYGVKQHHAKAHGSSLSKTAVECLECELTFKRRKDEVEEYDKQFCSQSCKATWQSENLNGEDNPNHTDAATLECVWCSSAFDCKPSHADRRRFCGRVCYSKWLSENNTDTNHPNHKEKIELTCSWCEETFRAYPYQQNSRQFCSWACRNEWMTGDSSPNWRGGRDSYYGPSWQEQRRRARDRDGSECQVCGRDDDVHVHHIRPFRTFGVKNHKQANALDNLICLCPEHHGKWEGIPLRPEVVADG